jgi:hypothetical protein
MFECCRYICCLSSPPSSSSFFRPSSSILNTQPEPLALAARTDGHNAGHRSEQHQLVAGASQHAHVPGNGCVCVWSKSPCLCLRRCIYVHIYVISRDSLEVVLAMIEESSSSFFSDQPTIDGRSKWSRAECQRRRRCMTRMPRCPAPVSMSSSWHR